MSIYDLEEDYESKYQDGWRTDPTTNQTVPVGCCLTMCPYNETQERERHQRLSKFEIIPNSKPLKPDTKLIIKEYTRSCAGREFTHATELRPWSVLKKTLDHLLLKICFENEDWMFICDFVYDRLKAVRQDMVIQRIEGMRYIEILEGSVRFMLYSLYRLICTLKDYTQADRPYQVIIPLESRVSGLNNYEMNVVREIKLTYRGLRDCLNSLIVQYQENVPNSKYRALFEAVNLIVNLPFLHGRDVICATEYIANKELRNKYSFFKTVFKMYSDHLSGNHLTALKHLPDLEDHPLLVVAYAPAIAQLQVHMLVLLRKLYSASAKNQAPIDFVTDIICPSWLEYDHAKRLLFTEFIAIQLGIGFDASTNALEFKKSSMVNPNGVYPSTGLIEMDISENETRVFALQMIIGKDFSFYRETIDKYCVESILNTNEPRVVQDYGC